MAEAQFGSSIWILELSSNEQNIKYEWHYCNIPFSAWFYCVWQYFNRQDIKSSISTIHFSYDGVFVCVWIWGFPLASSVFVRWIWQPTTPTYHHFQLGFCCPVFRIPYSRGEILSWEHNFASFRLQVVVGFSRVQHLEGNRIKTREELPIIIFFFWGNGRLQGPKTNTSNRTNRFCSNEISYRFYCSWM